MLVGLIWILESDVSYPFVQRLLNSLQIDRQTLSVSMTVQDLPSSISSKPPGSPTGSAPPPTLQEVLSSFLACGNKDRDVLIQLLVEKSQQDQLITQTQRAYYEELVRSSLVFREYTLNTQPASQPIDLSTLPSKMAVHQPPVSPAPSTFNPETTAQTDVPFIHTTGASTLFSPNHLGQFLMDRPSLPQPCLPLRDAAPQLFPVPSIRSEKPHVSRQLNWNSPVSSLTSATSARKTRSPSDDKSRREVESSFRLPPISSLLSNTERESDR